MINYTGTKTIETTRLILRRYEITDADDMFNNWVTDSEVTKFWGWNPHKDIEETKSVLQDWLKEYVKSDYYHWVIIYRENAQAIGYIYLDEINEDEKTAAVHYLISRKYWNKGIMTEVCKSVLSFAFTEMKLEKIKSRHYIDNSASGRVMQKCGMKLTGIARRDFPDCERISGEYCFYEISKEEWSV